MTKLVYGRAGWSKILVGIPNSFFVVFGLRLAPVPNFTQIGQKMQKLKIFAVGRFWLVCLVGKKIAVATSNSFNVAFGPSLAPEPNLTEIG